MSALRLARAPPAATKMLKFAGGYHGHADALLAQAGSGLATLGIPSSPGVPGGRRGRHARLRVQRPRGGAGARRAPRRRPRGGDRRAGRRQHGRRPAPQPGFLEGLRTVCNGTGALLVFDEVITGFRVGYGGGQERLARARRPDVPGQDRRRRPARPRRSAAAPT